MRLAELLVAGVVLAILVTHYGGDRRSAVNWWTCTLWRDRAWGWTIKIGPLAIARYGFAPVGFWIVAWKQSVVYDGWTRGETMKISCQLFGHRYKLTPPEATGTRFWQCAHCGRRCGTEYQHVGAPSRWLFTWWCGEVSSLLKIYAR